MAGPDPAALQQTWLTLYQTTLPSLARAKDSAQSQWPVALDHCFARIILDNAIGQTRPWTEAVRAPAWRNMSGAQLEAAIELGEQIATGEADLVQLDERSLMLRGKVGKTKRAGRENGSDAKQDAKSPKRKRASDDEEISRYFMPSPASPGKAKDAKRVKQAAGDTEHLSSHRKDEHDDASDSRSAATDEKINPITKATYPNRPPLELIENSADLTPFRKQVLRLLTQVPRGKHTSYQAMSDHITATSHKTCARAVGNAMRNNPFAPVVPCHRVLANDGRIGGFGGHWGDDGKYADRKKSMLREEGVRFDGKGKAVGLPFRDFK